MLNAKIALAYIANRVPNTYNTNERWVIKKMKSEYANIIVIILPIIYQKDKVQYFSNKSTMMISKVDHGKFVNWIIIMYFQLVKELIKWEKC
jgi:predicted nucleotidyltransferase